MFSTNKARGNAKPKPIVTRLTRTFPLFSRVSKDSSGQLHCGRNFHQSYHYQMSKFKHVKSSTLGQNKCTPTMHKFINFYLPNLVPRACVPLDQRLGNTTALGDSKTGNRIFWFRFDCARAPEMLDNEHVFNSQSYLAVFLVGFQSSPEVSIPGAD